MEGGTVLFIPDLLPRNKWRIWFFTIFIVSVASMMLVLLIHDMFMYLGHYEKVTALGFIACMVAPFMTIYSACRMPDWCAWTLSVSAQHQSIQIFCPQPGQAVACNSYLLRQLGYARSCRSAMLLLLRASGNWRLMLVVVIFCASFEYFSRYEHSGVIWMMRAAADISSAYIAWLIGGMVGLWAWFENPRIYVRD